MGGDKNYRILPTFRPPPLPFFQLHICDEYAYQKRVAET